MIYQKLAKILDQIGKGTISRAQAAVELDCSERTVNREMAKQGVTRPPSSRHEKRAYDHEVVAAHRELKRKVAQLVVDCMMTVERAAQWADCSERTIWRWIKRIQRVAKQSRRRKAK